MQKDANLVELEKCCRTNIFLQNFVFYLFFFRLCSQNFVSIQPRTSPVKFVRSARDPEVARAGSRHLAEKPGGLEDLREPTLQPLFLLVDGVRKNDEVVPVGDDPSVNIEFLEAADIMKIR